MSLQRTDSPLSNRKKSFNGRIATGAIFTLLAPAMIAIIFYDEKDALNQWIYRWQSLISGIFAIGAAFLTVRQMRRTDETQQVRHEEILQLQLRADALKIARAANPAIAIIDADVGGIRRLVKLRTQEFGIALESAHPDKQNSKLDEEWSATLTKFTDTFNYLLMQANRISQSLNSDLMSEAENLFDPILLGHRTRILMKIDETTGIFFSARVRLRVDGTQPNVDYITESYLLDLKSLIDLAFNAALELADEAEKFVSLMLKLQAAYRSGRLSI